jgi:glycosyltransferase involved in cell wall biosynthesis
MKIGFLASSWKDTPGGAAHAQIRLAHGLRERGHAVRFYHSGPRKKRWYGGVGSWDPKADEDVIICSAGMPSSTLTGDYKVVRSVHSAVNEEWSLRVGQRTDGIVFASRALARPFVDDSMRWVVSWPIVDKERYGVTGSETPGVHVTLVNPIPEKGGELLVELAQMLPEIPFLAVEGGWWKARQVGRDGPRNLRWMDYQHDARNIYRETRVLLYPGRWDAGEGWMSGVGMTALEASCAGIPVIASPGEGLLESMGGFATFVPSHSATDWAEAIQRVYHEDWERCHARALERARTLSPDHEIYCVEELLRSL